MLQTKYMWTHHGDFTDRVVPGNVTALDPAPDWFVDGERRFALALVDGRITVPVEAEGVLPLVALRLAHLHPLASQRAQALADRRVHFQRPGHFFFYGRNFEFLWLNIPSKPLILDLKYSWTYLFRRVYYHRNAFYLVGWSKWEL